MGSIMKIRVLIVDDHSVFRDGLKVAIDRENDMEVIGEAGSGQVAVALARELRPDVILMDVKMPVMDGAEATRLILSEMPGMKVLALSIYADDRYMENMMSAGALAYILKGCDSQELAGIIRRVAGSRRV
jgi:DNA-binding NarL/FixJ family response regulator